jgi:hypothetical protein
MLSQCAFFHKGVGPKLLAHFLPAEDVTAAGHQQQQRIEDLRRKRDKLVVLVQQPVLGIQPIEPEPIQLSGFQCHRLLDILAHLPILQCFLTTSSANLKDVSSPR